MRRRDALKTIGGLAGAAAATRVMPGMRRRRWRWEDAATADRHHHVRLHDDGEPQLRSRVRRAVDDREPAGRWSGDGHVARGPGRHAERRLVQPGPRHDVRPGSAPRLGSDARVVQQRHERRLRPAVSDGLRRRHRPDAVPDARRDAGQLRARRRVHQLRSLVLLGHGPDLAQPLLLAHRSVRWPDDERDPDGRHQLPDDLSPAQRQEGRVDLLLRHHPGGRRGQGPRRHQAGWLESHPQVPASS